MAHPTQDPRTQASTKSHIEDVRGRLSRLDAAKVFRTCGDTQAETGRRDLAELYWSEMRVLWDEASYNAERTDDWDEAIAIEALIEDE